MGNSCTTAIGDAFSCLRDHQNPNSIARGIAAGSGKDIDDAVIAATQNLINAQNLVQILRLTFRCKNLPNLDTFTRTDGVLFLYEKKGRSWNLIGHTEIIMDSLNPEWVKSFDLNYKFEEQQFFKAVVYDVDDFQNIYNFEKHDFIGEVEFNLHEIVTAKDQIYIKQIYKQKRDAVIEIIGEEQVQNDKSQQQILMIPVLELPIKSKYKGKVLFFIIYKQIKKQQGIQNQVWVPAYKSEIKFQHSIDSLKKIIEVEFNQLSLLVSDICGDDEEKQIKIEFFQSSKTGLHYNIGSTTFSITQLKDQMDQTRLEITNQSNSFFKFKFIQFKKRNTFLEYIFGGCEINLAIAVDFTLSNGKPTDPQSLHTLNLRNNQYYQALKSVGEILQFYDSDKQFPTFGFGAKLKLGINYKDGASHCFALNGNIFDPECDGLDGVLEAYKQAAKNIEFYGPTNFHEVIGTVNNMAEQLDISQDNQKYIILLIITDGIINDMNDTIDQIVRGSSLPLSIIIVGVGDADFQSMDRLDADDEPLFSQKYNKYMQSDIVQFVPFSEFKNDARLLAKETLEEIPRQFLSFMERKQIEPKSNVNHEIIKQQLNRKTGIQGIEQEPDQYFKKQENIFVEQILRMGFKKDEIVDMIRNKGVPEYNESIAIEGLKNINQYQNKLYQPQIKNEIDQNYSSAPQGNPIFRNSNIDPRVKNENIDFQYEYEDQDKNQCKICMNSQIETVCVPCGHRCMCTKCADSLSNKQCPICRKSIQQIVKTFDA